MYQWSRTLLDLASGIHSLGVLYRIPVLYIAHHSITSLGAMPILCAEATHMVISIDMLMVHSRSRWVTANSRRYEYAKLAQRRPALPK